MITQLEEQKQGILDTFNEMWKKVESKKTGKPMEPSQTLLKKAQAAEVTPTDSSVTGRLTNFYNQVTGKKTPITFSNTSQTGTEDQQAPTDISSSISDLLKTTSQYTDIRSFFDMALEGGQSFDSARQMAQGQGIDPDLAEYDFWSAQNARIRTLHVGELIQGLDQGSMWDVLTSLRKESPGTGNMVLTDTLITDLVNEGVLSKEAGKALKKVKLDSTGQLIEAPIETGTSASAKAATTKLLSIIKQRDAAYMKALKVKAPSKTAGIKVKLPKVTVFKPLKTTTPKSTTFKLKIPKIKSTQIPVNLKGLIHGNPRLY
jgi:hypothetical protein